MISLLVICIFPNRCDEPESVLILDTLWKKRQVWANFILDYWTAAFPSMAAAAILPDESPLLT